jgi:hypothetical protein
MLDFPRDPFVSRYPEPMTADEARREVKRALKLRRRVPLGHPFSVTPVWTPYPLAKLCAWLALRLSERRPRRRSGNGRR